MAHNDKSTQRAAKVPVPKKDKMASPSRSTPLAAPAGGAAQRERDQLFHNTRLLLSEYNNALTGYKQADAAALPFFSLRWREEARNHV